ncbi:MAG: NfeD family protein [Thermovirgaceae bacterium]
MKRKLLIVPFLLALVFTLSSGPAACAASDTSGSVVLRASLEGIIGIAMEDHLTEIFEEAEKTGTDLIVLDIDTPGGLATSMRAMYQAILESPVPVVVWVWPSGARAASAGAFIVLSSHVAAMVPGTNIGAAHPVTAGGGDIPDEEMAKKVTSDFAAQIRSLAEQRGRDTKACERMVTDSVSYTANEALEAGVIDIVAADLETLVKAVSGRTIQLASGDEIRMSLDSYEVRRYEMSPRLKILHFISRPDIAYLLLIVGIYAIIFEVLSPGGFVMGVSGAVLVLLGSYGLRMLPVNLAGVVLLVAGIAVMILDLFVGGVGVLSLFGAAALVFGGLIIYRAPGGELLHMSYSFLIGAVVVITAFFLLAAFAVWKSFGRAAVSGSEGMTGLEGVVISDLSPAGSVNCHGEIWHAVSQSKETIPRGQRVRVIRSEGLTLHVVPAENQAKTREGEKA